MSAITLRYVPGATGVQIEHGVRVAHTVLDTVLALKVKPEEATKGGGCWYCTARRGGALADTSTDPVGAARVGF